MPGTYYFLRVFEDGVAGFREYDVTTDKGRDAAMLFAFLMDGGSGREYSDDEGAMALAKTYVDIVEERAI